MFRRAPGRWTRLLTTTALATATAIAITGGQLPRLDRQQTAATADDPTVPTLFDLENAQQVRKDQCLLNGVLRKGGPATKEVARAGLIGTEAQLHTAANPEYWTATPLATSYKTDRAVADTKLDELVGRPDVWEGSLAIPSMSTPPGYTKTGFEWVESDANPFDTINLSSWVAAQYWKRTPTFTPTPTPRRARSPSTPPRRSTTPATTRTRTRTTRTARRGSPCSSCMTCTPTTRASSSSTADSPPPRPTRTRWSSGSTSRTSRRGSRRARTRTRRTRMRCWAPSWPWPPPSGRTSWPDRRPSGTPSSGPRNRPMPICRRPRRRSARRSPSR